MPLPMQKSGPISTQNSVHKLWHLSPTLKHRLVFHIKHITVLLI